MAYDNHHIFINGESLRASGRDARLMRALADQRHLDAASVRGASSAARALIGEWLACGWLRAPDQP
jgi:50S ribosomal protein L16 3-hydroxylase